MQNAARTTGECEQREGWVGLHGLASKITTVAEAGQLTPAPLEMEPRARRAAPRVVTPYAFPAAFSAPER